MSVYRIYVEKKPEFAVEAQAVRNDLQTALRLSVSDVRILNRYDADHLTEKNATLTDEKEIMQTAGKDPEAKETAKAVPLKEEALPEHPAETELPAEIMLRMTEEAADTVRAAPGNEGMQEREADPAMQIRRIMKTMIVLMSRKTGTAMKILKNCSRKDVGWILKIWRILMSRKNMKITGMPRI